MRFQLALLFAVWLAALDLSAHPMPYSVMLLEIKGNGIAAGLQMPLKELQLVFPDEDIDRAHATLLQRKGAWLDHYLLQHLSVADTAGQPWAITIKGKTIREDEQDLTGKYHELIFDLWLQAPAGASPRQFRMRYDAIMHQVVTHKMLIRIRQDWEGGMISEGGESSEVGMLGVNTADNTIPPVIVNLDEGSAWKGFRAMVSLGMEHIAEGTDHLLFLLVLLLPAPLIAERKRWTVFGGTRYSVIRLVKIATAFTVGHSVSLLFGALNWLVLPQKPVEIAIAMTILVTAIHAIRPLFYGREVFIAAGFGLIHGLAFATVLSDLDLDAGKMALSILGFNIGIELMQLFAILCVVPWLIVLSKNNMYSQLRISGAAVAIVASLAWAAERIAEQPNGVSSAIQAAADQSKWLLLGLVCFSIITAFTGKK